MADEHGSVAVVVALALTIATLLGLVTVDLGTVMMARRTAVAAADAAALAAAGTHHPSGRTGPGPVAARVVADANGAQLLTCRCRTLPVTVTVQVPVTTLLLGQLGLRAVTAAATADLVR